MKKTLLSLFILCGIFVFSQNQLLFMPQWKVTKVKYNNEFHNYVPSSLCGNNNSAAFASTSLSTKLYNTIMSQISVTDSQISVYQTGGTLAQCQDGPFDKFESAYRSVLEITGNPKVFDYTITQDGYEYNLILTEPSTGNQIYYWAGILSINDIPKDKLKIFPNPVDDVLKIGNLGEVSLIKIYDSSGKLVIQTIEQGNKTLEINVKYLPAGNYFVKINDEKIVKIIKK